MSFALCISWAEAKTTDDMIEWNNESGSARHLDICIYVQDIGCIFSFSYVISEHYTLIVAQELKT